jgi:hypothetical protein
MEILPPEKITDLKNQVITDEIMEYSDLNELKTLISKLKKESDDSIDELKEVILPLVDELVRLSGDHMLIMYKQDIVNFINKNPKMIVDTLILRCYEDKEGILRAKIVRGDESFFLQNNFEDMTEGDTQIMSIIFKFKDFWGKLNQENKEILKSYLLTIVSLCDIRFLSFKKYVCLKKLNSKHSKLFEQYDSIF